MKKREKLFYIFIIVCFIIISLVVGSRHEQWADEAHAWLIARDTSFYTLFFKYLHTDGHPALWHLILKFFQLIGFKYKYMYIISTLFSSIGVSIFLFKSKFKWYIKLLLPFSYFVIYQYTVISRGYCLILMLLSLVASLWDKRVSKCYLFSFSLILLLSSEAYTFFLAGMIYLIYIYDYIKLRNSINNRKSFLACLIVLGIFFLITVLYVYPISSNTFLTTFHFFNISDSFITTYNQGLTVKLIFSLVILILINFVYFKESSVKKFIQFWFLVIPIFLFYNLMYYNAWHLGIFFLIVIFILWIQNFVNSKVLNIFFLICLLVQCYWSFSSIRYDLFNTYSPSLEVANFIKKYDYDNLEILGASFHESAVNPYFDKNIYDNWNSDIAFYYWNTNNIYYDDLIYDKVYDIVVVSDYYINEFNKLGYELGDRYNSYYFDGYSYIENYKYESLGTTVYVLKEIDNLG